MHNKGHRTQRMYTLHCSKNVIFSQLLSQNLFSQANYSQNFFQQLQYFFQNAFYVLKSKIIVLSRGSKHHLSVPTSKLFMIQNEYNIGLVIMPNSIHRQLLDNASEDNLKICSGYQLVLASFFGKLLGNPGIQGQHSKPIEISHLIKNTLNKPTTAMSPSYLFKHLKQIQILDLEWADQ